MEFFIFPFPNRAGEGPIQWYYATDGTSTVAKGCRTKTDCVRAVRAHLKTKSLNLRQNPLNKREMKEAGGMRDRYAKASASARETGWDIRADEYGGIYQGIGMTMHKFGPKGKRGNPLTDPESAEEMRHAKREDVAADGMDRPENRAYARGMARGTRQTIQRRGSRSASHSATDAIIRSGTRSNPRTPAQLEKYIAEMEERLQWEKDGAAKAYRQGDAGKAKFHTRQIPEIEGIIRDAKAKRENPLTRDERSMIKRRAHSLHLEGTELYEDASEMDHYESAAYTIGAASEAHMIADAYSDGGPRAKRRNPQVVQAPRAVNPLTMAEQNDMWTRERAMGRELELPSTEPSHAQELRGRVRESFATRGRYQARKGYKGKRPRTGAKRALRSAKLATAAVRANPGELSAPQRAMLQRLNRVPGLLKSGLPVGQSSALGALKRKKMVTELKTKWKILAKGRKAIGAGPARKAAKKRVAKKAVKRKAVSAICRHSIGLEKGTKKKLAVVFPRACFKTLAAAVTNIRTELRARFKSLAKVPSITRAEWKYSDKAKTRGKWHFTATKRKK